jgi:hypothetical protein
MYKKTQSNHFVILFFSVLTLIFNVYLLYLKCIPKIPDKIILILMLLITLSLITCILLKVVKYKDKETDPLVKDILDIVHWGYLIVIPVGILLARSVPLIVLMICVSWFALIGRAIYDECPLTAIAEKSTLINTREEIVNLFFTTCVVIGCIRLLIN